MVRPGTSCRPFLFLVLVLLCGVRATANAETWEPVSSGFNTEIRIWTSGGNTFAEVRLTFPNTGYRVTDWGEVSRTDSDFSVDAKVERWTGASGQAVTTLEHTYALGAVAAGAYSFTFKSHGIVIKSQQFDPSQAGEHWAPMSPTGVTVGIRIWTNGAITYTKVELYLPDTGHRVTDWGQITGAGNDFSVDIGAERWTGESEVRVSLAEQTYPLGALAPGTYFLDVKINGSLARRQQFSIGTSSSPSPRLLTEGNTERAIVVDSVTRISDSFPLITTHNFSSDQRTRVILFATDVELGEGEGLSAVTAQAQDSQLTTYPLTVEYVGKVPNQDGLTQIVIKLPAEVGTAGDTWLSINVRGVASNRVLISIKPSGNGSP